MNLAAVHKVHMWDVSCFLGYIIPWADMTYSRLEMKMSRVNLQLLDIWNVFLFLGIA